MSRKRFLGVVGWDDEMERKDAEFVGRNRVRM